MIIKFSKHALQRMQERYVKKAVVYDVITNPQKLEQSLNNQQRFIAKKIYYNEKLLKTHLLMVIYGVMEESVIEVITIIDTSKIKKYL